MKTTFYCGRFFTADEKCVDCDNLKHEKSWAVRCINKKKIIFLEKVIALLLVIYESRGVQVHQIPERVEHLYLVQIIPPLNVEGEGLIMKKPFDASKNQTFLSFQTRPINIKM